MLIAIQTSAARLRLHRLQDRALLSALIGGYALTDAKLRRQQRRAFLNYSGQSVDFSDASYTVDALPAVARGFIACLGLKQALLSAKAPPAVTFEALRRGQVPAQKSKAPPRRSRWREAVAHALAHAAAVAELPEKSKRATIEAAAQSKLNEMRTHTARLDKGVVRRLAERADVQEQFRLLFGTKPDDAQHSLLAVAGVVNGPSGVDGPLLDAVPSCEWATEMVSA